MPSSQDPEFTLLSPTTDYNDSFLIVIILLFNFRYEEEEDKRKGKHKSEDWNALLKGLMNMII